MGLVLLISIAVFAAMAVAFLALFRSLARVPHEAEPDFTCLAEPLSLRYRPMERLLADDDFAYLSGFLNFDYALLSRMRTERRRIFRLYLKTLKDDFSRIHGAAMFLLLSSDQDRQDLAGALMRQRALFAANLLRVELRLALHAAGVGAMDIRPLVEVAEALRAGAAGLAAQTAAVKA